MAGRGDIFLEAAEALAERDLRAEGLEQSDEKVSLGTGTFGQVPIYLL